MFRCIGCTLHNTKENHSHSALVTVKHGTHPLQEFSSPPPTPSHHTFYIHHFQDMRFPFVPFICSGPFLRKVSLYLLHPQSLILSRPSSNICSSKVILTLQQNLCLYFVPNAMTSLIILVCHFPSKQPGDTN